MPEVIKVKRIKVAIFRRSLAASIIIAIFWMIWSSIYGGVPTIAAIKITSEWNYHFPFTISRWWDILIGPVWVIAFMLAGKLSEYVYLREKEKDDSTINYSSAAIAAGLFFGIILTAPCILAKEGLGFVLVALSVIMTILWAPGILILGSERLEMASVIIFGLNGALGVSLVFGLFFGLGLGLLLLLAIILSIMPIVLIRTFLNSRTWGVAWRWLNPNCGS